MKRLSFLLLILFQFIVITKSSAILPPNFDRDYYQFKGNVAAVTVKNYEAVDKGDVVELGKITNNIYMAHFKDATLPHTYTTLNAKGDILHYFILSYCKDNLCTSVKKYSNMDLTEIYQEFEYVQVSGEKKIKRSKVLRANGDLITIQTNKYDAKGNLIAEEKVNANNAPINTYNYTYDTYNRLSKAILYNANGVIVKKETSTYNADGQLEMVITYNAEVIEQQRISYTYNSNGDKAGLKITYKSKPTTYYTYDYTCDTQGNWIKAIINKSNCVPVSVIMRKIEYKVG